MDYGGCSVLKGYKYSRSIIVVIFKIYLQKGIDMAESFMSSFSWVYMTDIYKTFDTQNVLPILSSDYANNTERVLKQVVHFLGLRKYTYCCFDPIPLLIHVKYVKGNIFYPYFNTAISAKA